MNITAPAFFWRIAAVIALIGALPAAAEVTETSRSPCYTSYRDITGDRSAECGTLQRPLDSANPGLGDITIHYVRLPALRPKNQSPVFFIAGGPGQAAHTLVKPFSIVFSELRKHRDLIFVDQRGTGHSNALNCEWDAMRYTDVPPQEAIDAFVKRQQACIDDYDVDLRLFSTPRAIEDLEAVRKALGYAQINLWGGSYGSRVGLAYLSLHPDSINAAVLDGLAPVGILSPRYTARDAGNALAKVLNACSKQAPCREAFPHLAKRWQDTLKRWERQPRKVPIENPRTGKPIEMYIDHTVLSQWARAMLYQRELSPLIPLALDQATRDQFDTLAAPVMASSEAIEEGIASGMHFAVVCAEDFRLSGNSPAVPPKHPLMLLGDLAAMDKVCALFEADSPPENYFELTKSSVPTLLLSGNFDPVTPELWAKNTSEKLLNHRLVTAPGGHHIIAMQGCLPNTLNEFFDSPEALNILDTDCVNQVGPAHFFIDIAGPKMAEPHEAEWEHPK